MNNQAFAAARNPYAMAEAVLGRKVEWDQVEDRPAFLEEVLHTPYEQLFDPKYDSPLYLGFALDSEGELVERAPDFTPAEVERGTDAENFPDLDEHTFASLGDLRKLVGDDLDAVPLRRFRLSRAGGMEVEIGQTPALRRKSLSRVFDKAVLGRLLGDWVFDFGWTPDGGEWKDTGSFFKEATEYFDPVQGSVGDCWLIAAMSSVAWALPYSFAQRSRATGPDNSLFTNLIEFTDHNDGKKYSFEVTDEIVVYSGTSWPMYARSSEDGELWPGLVEKAYAMWRSGKTYDHANITVLNGGDTVAASAQLTARKPHYTHTKSSTSKKLLNLVKTHSVNHRTVNPMTAWTYSSAAKAPDNIDYSSANIVASHAYSVLGWITGPLYLSIDRLSLAWPGDINPTQDYIVLRNPWGNTEATVGQHEGVVSMRDVSFWRTIDLANIDGVFAITPSTFKKYFEGIGVAL